MRSMKTFVTLMALFFATIMLFTGLAQAQQVIGTFPKMDGGFEGQNAGVIWNKTGFKDTSISVWTVNVGPATVITTGGRSGPKYVNYTYASASGGRPLQSPTADSGAIIASTLYTIQYYYRTTSDTATAAVMTACIALNGTVDGFTKSPASGGFSLAGTSNAWVKHTDSIKITSSLTPKWGLAGVRAGGVMGIALNIDDFVVYAGGVDSVAPDVPISPTTPLISGTRIQLSWTAPSTGVDSGGYMVVRGLADPSTVPTVNGIYAVGNTIAPGEQVVYLGTSTSFTDVGLNWNTRYYYRIYTVDKAFNYSSSVSVNATTNTLPSDALINGSFGSSAGWTALLDLGGGMQATFDYNYGTVPTGGVAPGLRVVGPVTPGDWSAQVNSMIYQALSLSAANSYLLSGVIEAVKDSNSHFWLEVWLVDVEPAAGKDITLANYPNAINLAALKESGWGGVDNYNGPLSGCLPTPATAFTVSKTGTYYLALKGGCGGGGIMDVLLDNLKLTGTLVGVKNGAASVIKTFSLQQNYPNPFNPNTKFTYQMCKTALVSIKVYDLLGREVATLVNEVKQAGSYPIEWDATRYSSGVYFYRMQTGSFVDVKKMVLMK